MKYLVLALVVFILASMCGLIVLGLSWLDRLTNILSLALQYQSAILWCAVIATVITIVLGSFLSTLNVQ